jgi:molybdopterin converting factor small subunit
VAVTVVVPSVLRAEANGESSLSVDVGASGTVATVLDGLAADYPKLERRLRDERGELRRYVNIFVDGEECRRIGGKDAPVPDRAEFLIIPSVAGG